jgi:hypothetical protein
MSSRGASRAREAARSLLAAAVALAFASSCAPGSRESSGALIIEIEGELARISVELPPEAREAALLGGRELLDRPWIGTGGERLTVALDADGLVPLAAIGDVPGRFGVELPLAAVRAALGERGRYLQARWRDGSGAWALGAAFHAHAAEPESGRGEIALHPARAIAARRAAPIWLAAAGGLALAAAAGIALRRLRRIPVPALVGIASALAWIAAVPRAARDLGDLRWRPDPLFLAFARRAAERAHDLPRGVLVELSGPAHLRCRLAELLPTERLAHAFGGPDASGGPGRARLGPELASRESECVVERWAEWSFLVPREPEASR